MSEIKALAMDFCAGRYDHEVDAGAWSIVFNYLIDHAASLSANKQEIHKLWIVSGGRLRDKIRDDALILQVLRLYLPGYQGRALTLYRGECKFLYDVGKVGFCWTPKRDIAEMFASGLNSIDSAGVLLEAHVAAKAILAGPIDYSWTAKNEEEHTCDPTQITNIKILSEYPKGGN